MIVVLDRIKWGLGTKTATALQTKYLHIFWPNIGFLKRLLVWSLQLVFKNYLLSIADLSVCFNIIGCLTFNQRVLLEVFRLFIIRKFVSKLVVSALLYFLVFYKSLESLCIPILGHCFFVMYINSRLNGIARPCLNQSFWRQTFLS